MVTVAAAAVVAAAEMDEVQQYRVGSKVQREDGGVQVKCRRVDER